MIAGIPDQNKHVLNPHYHNSEVELKIKSTSEKRTKSGTIGITGSKERVFYISKEDEINKWYDLGRDFGSSLERTSAHSELCKGFLTQN